ncbi:MAG: BrnT family toxin [Alphaproteobacteria bacterium]
MSITYDTAKNERNIALRGLSFDLVADLDWDSAIIREDTRRIYGEARFRVLGSIAGRLHMMVYTPRGGSVRVISLRRANGKEVQEWLKK